MSGPLTNILTNSIHNWAVVFLHSFIFRQNRVEGGGPGWKAAPGVSSEGAQIWLWRGANLLCFGTVRPCISALHFDSLVSMLGPSPLNHLREANVWFVPRQRQSSPRASCLTSWRSKFLKNFSGQIWQVLSQFSAAGSTRGRTWCCSVAEVRSVPWEEIFGKLSRSRRVKVWRMWRSRLLRTGRTPWRAPWSRTSTCSGLKSWLHPPQSAKN